MWGQQVLSSLFEDYAIHFQWPGPDTSLFSNPQLQVFDSSCCETLLQLLIKTGSQRQEKKTDTEIRVTDETEGQVKELKTTPILRQEPKLHSS